MLYRGDDRNDGLGKHEVEQLAEGLVVVGSVGGDKVTAGFEEEEDGND